MKIITRPSIIRQLCKLIDESEANGLTVKEIHLTEDEANYLQQEWPFVEWNFCEDTTVKIANFYYGHSCPILKVL